MRIYTLERKTFIPSNVEHVWDFFSSPSNLNALTPPDLSFEILSQQNDSPMMAGLIIHYKIRPLLNIPLRWTTEITHCQAQHYFVDEQRFGPYAFWHHLHKFEATPKGVLMTDLVHYALPLGILGRFMQHIYVHKRLTSIFDFRAQRIEQIFGETKAQ